MILKNKITKIIDAIKDTDISEIEISTFWGAQKIKLKKGIDYQNSKTQSSVDSEISKVAPDYTKTVDSHIVNQSTLNESDEIGSNIVINDNYTIVKAPLVGTFYLSPKPGQPVFISKDSKVSVGDTLCIIEAMKIFNEIESDYSGVIKEILVQDGDPVEYDQPLFKIEEI